MVAQTSSHLPSVLIIERDDTVRRMIAVALEHAGFRTFAAKDAPTDGAEHAVIVRDATRPVELAAIAPELLNRTIVTTTTQGKAAKAIGGRVFAVIEKPFDLEEFVGVVARCANRSRCVEPPRMESVRRFVTSAESIRRMLAVPVTSPGEATLHAEMRRTLDALSATLNEAAHVETSRGRVALFRAASTMAAKLATSTSRRDH